MMMVLIITIAILALYSVLMIWLFVGISSSSVPIVNSTKPSVTIIVALRNEAANLNLLLDGLKGVKYPGNLLEIILVNDNSTDSTYQDLVQFESAQITILNNSGNGKKQAIEEAIKIAKGDWIAVTDADCNIPGTWISSMVKNITEDTKMILGPVFISDTSNFLGSLQSIEFFGLQGATAGSSRMAVPISANAANMMFRKDAFEKVNPYADNYQLKTGDDQFLLMAITNHYSRSVVYSMKPESIVLTTPVDNWKQYWSQRMRWASKGSAYTQASPKLVGLIVFFTSLIFPILVFGGWFFMDSILVIGLISMKIISDFLVVFPMKKFAGISVSPKDYLVSIVFYPFVVVWSVINGVIKK